MLEPLRYRTHTNTALNRRWQWCMGKMNCWCIILMITFFTNHVKGNSGSLFKKITIDEIRVGHVTCFGESNGSILIDARIKGKKDDDEENDDEANIALEYSINNGTQWKSDNSFEGLESSEYVILVKFKKHNSKPEQVVINTPSKIASGIIHVAPYGCGILENGSAGVMVSGGTPPHYYSWNSDPIQHDSIAIRLAPGEYTISVEGSLGCQVENMILIIESPEPIEIACPGYGTMEACISPEDVAAKLEEWFQPFYENELKYAQVEYEVDINGDVISDISELNTVIWNSSEGGYISVTTIIICNGSQESCSATMFIFDPPQLACSVPAEKYTGACDNLDATFAMWINEFNAGGGCNMRTEYRVTRSNGMTNTYGDLYQLRSWPDCFGNSLHSMALSNLYIVESQSHSYGYSHSTRSR